MRKGFTLIELSIVLVIIGLLVGGILVAQSVVETAKITSQINQFQQLDIAASQFKNKYGQLPGDSSLFLPTGNNNNEIQAWNTSGSGYGGQGASLEVGSFFKHLSDSGMIMTTYVSANNVTLRAGNAVPGAKIGVKGSLVFGTGLLHGEGVQDGNTIAVPTGSYWYLCNEGAAGSSGLFCAGYGHTGGALTAVQALAIDTKMDDSMPWSGDVIAGSQAGLSPTYPAYAHAGDIYGCTEQEAVANPQTGYLVSQNRPACNLHVKMFSIAGGKN
jgi:prepilin-type N-terminal cleavage/methylation domain-containing protein